MQANQSSSRLMAAQNDRRNERARLTAALQGVHMELFELKGHLKETKIDMQGLANVHHSIVRSLVSQNQEAKTELSNLMSRQPGAMKLESRLAQSMQEKESVRLLSHFSAKLST